MVRSGNSGRLAVEQAHRGKQLGATLLWDAVARAQRLELAVVALAVDARDDKAATFYRHHGFVRSGSAAHQLLLFLANVTLPTSSVS